MSVEFDVGQIRVAEFGVGERGEQEEEFTLVPIDLSVREALIGEAESTLSGIAEPRQVNPQEFDPGEKYGPSEYLVLPLGHEWAAPLARLHGAVHLAQDSPALEQLRSAFCYFLRATDREGRRLTALNRASQFKATLGKQGKLMRWVSDGLHVIPDPVVQLNAGFDVVIDAKWVHILHPASFRSLGNVDAAIAEAVPRNVEAISRSASYVEWSSIAQYAASRSRAAGLIASISAHGYAESLDRAEVESLCSRTGVVIDTSGDRIVVPDSQVLAFLEVIDRRRYEIGLVPGRSEQYRASSRTRVGGGSQRGAP